MTITTKVYKTTISMALCLSVSIPAYAQKIVTYVGNSDEFRQTIVQFTPATPATPTTGWQQNPRSTKNCEKSENEVTSAINEFEKIKFEDPQKLTSYKIKYYKDKCQDGFKNILKYCSNPDDYKNKLMINCARIDMDYNQPLACDIKHSMGDFGFAFCESPI